MSTLKADAIEAATGTNTDLELSGKGTGVPDIAAGFKVGGSAGVPTASIQDDAVTLAKLASGTDGELITWDASGDPAAVAVGTATHILTSNGAGAAPTFQAAAGGGAWTFIASATASTSATLGVSGIDTTYRTYALSLTGFQPVSDNTNIRLRVGDSGGIETSGGYWWQFGKVNSTNATYDAASSTSGDTSTDYDTYMKIGEYIGNSTREFGGGLLFIHINGDGRVQVEGNCSWGFNTTGGVVGGWIIGAYTEAAFALTQLQLYFETGNISVGTMDLWGLKHS